jgi:hypothetical protein
LPALQEIRLFGGRYRLIHCLWWYNAEAASVLLVIKVLAYCKKKNKIMPILYQCMDNYPTGYLSDAGL